MGEMKRAQALRVDEFSVQKWGESHETIRRLTLRVQELQEQMNSMNDSGEFQEVESNHSGRLSYVPSRPAAIPNCRYVLSRDKRLPLDTWNLSGRQENVFGNLNFLHLIRTKIIIKEFTIPMPTSARRPSSMSSLFLVAFPQNSMVGQQRQQISELQFDKFTTFSQKIRFKTQVSSCSDFPSDALLWIKEVEMDDSVDELKSWRSTAVEDFQILNFWTREMLLP